MKNHSNLALAALAVGAFGIGTTEFSPMGMLPVIAKGVHASIPSAGMLVSAYALGVMVGAPVITLGLGRMRTRAALVLLMGVYTIGNLLSAMAPGYTTLMIARIVTSLAHGAFFGIGATVAAGLVPREKRASAIATMFMGLTIANIGGVPAATWLGNVIGWRATFASMGVLGALAMLSVYVALPRGEAAQAPQVRKELQVLLRPNVLNALFTTVCGSAGMFALYTYVSPLLSTITHAGGPFITLSLVLIGIGFTVGNYLGGRLGNVSVERAVLVFMTALAVVLLLVPVMARTPITAAIAMLLFGVASFAIVPPVQMRVMHEAEEAPGLASSVNIGAFNLGNALGAFAGGLVLSRGLGYSFVPLSGTVFAVLGMVLVGGRIGLMRGLLVMPVNNAAVAVRNRSMFNV